MATPYVPHVVVKDQKIADSASALTAQSLVLAKLFTREGIEQFKGQEGDKIVKRVEGRLPYRRYAFRNNRVNPILFDVYKESKSEVTFGDRLYSGVRLTDEQKDFDGINWDRLLPKQSEAVARGVEAEAAKLLESAPYEVTIGGAQKNMRSAVLEARKVLKRFRVLNGVKPILVVGSDFEQALLENEKIVFAQASGDSVANSALVDATLGGLAGFTVVSDITIDPKAAYAFVGSGFYMINGAPSLPMSVKHGGIGNVDGVAMRWMTDYDQNYQEDRSSVVTYTGTGLVKDRLAQAVFYAGDSAVPEDKAVPEPELTEHFLRGVKLTLDGTSVYPGDTTAVAKETGVKASTAWNGSAHDATPTVLTD